MEKVLAYLKAAALMSFSAAMVYLCIFLSASTETSREAQRTLIASQGVTTQLTSKHGPITEATATLRTSRATVDLARKVLLDERKNIKTIADNSAETTRKTNETLEAVRQAAVGITASQKELTEHGVQSLDALTGTLKNADLVLLATRDMVQSADRRIADPNIDRLVAHWEGLSMHLENTSASVDKVAARFAKPSNWFKSVLGEAFDFAWKGKSLFK